MNTQIQKVFTCLSTNSKKHQSNAQRSQAQKTVQLYYKGLADVQNKTVQNSLRVSKFIKIYSLN